MNNKTNNLNTKCFCCHKIHHALNLKTYPTGAGFRVNVCVSCRDINKDIAVRIIEYFSGEYNYSLDDFNS